MATKRKGGVSSKREGVSVWGVLGWEGGEDKSLLCHHQGIGGGWAGWASGRRLSNPSPTYSTTTSGHPGLASKRMTQCPTSPQGPRKEGGGGRGEGGKRGVLQIGVGFYWNIV